MSFQPHISSNLEWLKHKTIMKSKTLADDPQMIRKLSKQMHMPSKKRKEGVIPKLESSIQMIEMKKKKTPNDDDEEVVQTNVPSKNVSYTKP